MRIFFTFLIIFIPVDAYAYLDPGIANIVLQSIIGIIAAISSGILFFWNEIKKKFFKIFKKKSDNAKSQR
jgi:hypothetical protein